LLLEDALLQSNLIEAHGHVRFHYHKKTISQDAVKPLCHLIDENKPHSISSPASMVRAVKKKRQTKRKNGMEPNFNVTQTKKKR
jgi:hypothetical protein